MNEKPQAIPYTRNFTVIMNPFFPDNTIIVGEKLFNAFKEEENTLQGDDPIVPHE